MINKTGSISNLVSLCLQSIVNCFSFKSQNCDTLPLHIYHFAQNIDSVFH